MLNLELALELLMQHFTQDIMLYSTVVTIAFVRYKAITLETSSYVEVKYELNANGYFRAFYSSKMQDHSVPVRFTLSD